MLVATATVIAACGSTPAQSIPDRATLAREYQQAIPNANAATYTFQVEAKTLNPSATVPAFEIASLVAPLVSSIERANSRLLRMSAPPKIMGDIRALVDAENLVIKDLKIGPLSGIPSWVQQVTTDSMKAVAIENIVDADLGLPPYSPPPPLER